MLMVQPSSIREITPEHPWGVFTRVFVPFSTKLLIYGGELITRRERKWRDPLGVNPYMFEAAGHNMFIDATDADLAGMARFVNCTGPGESHLANTEMNLNANGELELTAIMDIPAGHELFYDYSRKYEWRDDEHKNTTNPVISWSSFLSRS
jgi:hypothetical protein